MKKTSVRHASKLEFCEVQNEQEGLPKKIQGLLQREDKNPGQEREINEADFTRGYKLNEPCSDTSICSQESEVSAWRAINLGEYEQLSLWKLTPMLKQSCDLTSQISPSIQTSEIIIPEKENSTSLQWDGRVQAHQTQEVKQDYPIQPPHSGEKDLEYCSKPNPSSVLWNNLKDLSNEDLELFLPASIWQDTVGKLKQSRRRSLGQDTKDSDCLSFPTLTSNECFTSRPAGQNKCEKWFKDNGLIQPGYQLGTRAIALMMGYPSNWFEELREQYSKNPNTPSQVKPQAELEQGIWQDEQLHQDKQRSLSEESSTSQKLLGGDEKLLEHEKEHSLSGSEVLLGGEKLLEHKRGERSSPNQKLSIPCLVKQPKQPEVKGVIRKDEGDRFLVEVDGKEIFISKLFVYPDLSKSVRQIPPTKKVTPPSKIPPSKTRRKKGDGTGYLYSRTITRRGKQYQEHYYRYRDESGKLRAKYIPQKLLDRIQEAESRKLTVADVLKLLGVNEISRGEQFSTFDDGNVPNSNESDELISLNRGEQVNNPSTKRRKYGYGGGYIECKPITKNGTEYKQYWFHWQVWRDGETVTKKSRYIPKRLVPKVERMNNEKEPVEKILKVLENRVKRKK